PSHSHTKHFALVSPTGKSLRAGVAPPGAMINGGALEGGSSPQSHPVRPRLGDRCRDPIHMLHVGRIGQRNGEPTTGHLLVDKAPIRRVQVGEKPVVSVVLLHIELYSERGA